MTKLLPDCSAQDVSIKDVHQSLLLNGCCMLRGAIEKNVVIKMANRVNVISQIKAERARSGDLKDADKRCHIYEPEFQRYSGGSLYDIIENTKLTNILESLFGIGKFHRHDLTNCRSIDIRPDSQRDLTSFHPLVFHLDALYHPPYDKFAINFWIPLNECGIDSPGIQVIPISHINVRRLINFDSHIVFTPPANDESPWSMKNVWQKIAGQMPDAVVWQPHFSLGDVMIMTSWVPHASYATPNMTNPRRSIELRHHGEEFDPNPISAS